MPTRRKATAAVSLMIPVLLASCAQTPGSSSSGTASGTPSSSGTASATPSAVASGSSEVAAAAAAVDALYQGDFTPPPSSGAPAQKGKSVWIISCGQAYEACSVNAAAFEEAGQALGWDVTVVDGQADPSVAAQGLRQAIAAKADAVAITAFDCAGISSPLKEAAAAGVITVASFSADCNQGASGSPLFTATVTMKGQSNVIDLYEEWGKAKAAYLIAKSDGGAQVVALANVDQQVQKANQAGFLDGMKACSSCSVVQTVDFSFSEVPAGLTQKFSSALLQHPDADSVYVPFDALYGLGASTVLKQNADRDLLNIGGECFMPNLDLIREGVQTACLSLSFPWAAWAVADDINRLFAGESAESLPDQGSGWQLVDADHNLPAAGSPYEPPIDFGAAYLNVWTGS